LQKISALQRNFVFHAIALFTSLNEISMLTNEIVVPKNPPFNYAITIVANSLQEVEHLLTLIKALNISHVHITTPSMIPQSLPIVRGNKKLDPTALFGIWKDKPRNLEQIRASAWNRNWKM
jgi:hypothetical protein